VKKKFVEKLGKNSSKKIEEKYEIAQKNIINLPNPQCPRITPHHLQPSAFATFAEVICFTFYRLCSLAIFISLTRGSISIDLYAPKPLIVSITIGIMFWAD
jgi:hypothetical protein